jgi:hypothetical protein
MEGLPAQILEWNHLRIFVMLQFILSFLAAFTVAHESTWSSALALAISLFSFAGYIVLLIMQWHTQRPVSPWAHLANEHVEGEGDEL